MLDHPGRRGTIEDALSSAQPPAGPRLVRVHSALRPGLARLPFDLGFCLLPPWPRSEPFRCPLGAPHSTLSDLRGTMLWMTDFGAARISDHARMAMARRAITEAQVQGVLRAPQMVVPGNRPGRTVVQGPVMLGNPPLEVLLRVVVDVARTHRGGPGVRDHPVQVVRSEAMKITYGTATDTLTVVLRDAPARISEEEKSGVILDYDASDRLIAIEVLDASARVDSIDTVQLRVIPKAGARQLTAAE